MKWSIELVINEVPMTNNQLNGKGWKARWAHTRKWEMIVDCAIERAGGYPPEPLKKATVKLIRHSARQLDKDNLYASFKPVLDALKSRRARVARTKEGKLIGNKNYIPKVIEDDSPKHIELICEQVKTKMSEKFTVIRVMEE